MSRQLPYYKMYPADAETDENFRLMSYEQRGLYWTLLDHAWLNDGLPVSDTDLMALLRVSKEDFERMWERVSKCFPKVNGRRRNKRQEEERTKAISKSERASESVRTRYERSTNDSPRALTRGESESESSEVKPETKTETSTRGKLPVGYAFDEHYAEFRQACADFGMAVIDSDFTHGAWFEWLKLDFEQRRAAIAGIEERRENGTDPQMVPRPEKYLKNREWKRMVRKVESAIERSIRLA